MARKSAFALPLADAGRSAWVCPRSGSRTVAAASRRSPRTAGRRCSRSPAAEPPASRAIARATRLTLSLMVANLRVGDADRRCRCDQCPYRLSIAGDNPRVQSADEVSLCAGSPSPLCSRGAPAASAVTFTPGAAGAGDPFFPLAGNGGYDVRNYSLRLDFEPRNNALSARAVITARATQDLSRFDLDLRGLHVAAVTVDGARADVHARRPGADHHARGRDPRRARPSTSPSTTTAIRSRSSTPTSPRTDGSRPTTARSSSTSRRARRAGIRSTTRRRTRRPTTSRSRCRRGGPRSPTAGSSVSADNGATTTWRWRASDPTAPYLATATNGIFEMRVGSMRADAGVQLRRSADADLSGQDADAVSWPGIGSRSTSRR